MFPVNQRIRITVTFKDATNVLVDPTTVTFKIKDPTGAIGTYIFGVDGGLIKDSTGTYHKDIVLDKPGKWWAKGEGSGNMNVATPETLIQTEPSEIYV